MHSLRPTGGTSRVLGLGAHLACDPQSLPKDEAAMGAEGGGRRTCPQAGHKALGRTPPRKVAIHQAIDGPGVDIFSL